MFGLKFSLQGPQMTEQHGSSNGGRREMGLAAYGTSKSKMSAFGHRLVLYLLSTFFSQILPIQVEFQPFSIIIVAINQCLNTKHGGLKDPGPA